MQQTWVEKIIREYADEANHLSRYKKTLDTTDPDQRDESDIVSGMISDLRYALTWLRTGRRPGNRRGAERRDVYRQRALFAELQSDLSDQEKENLVMLLLSLSTRERQCFLLHMAHGLTQEEIAGRLKVSRRTVRQYIERAKSKVQQEVTC